MIKGRRGRAPFVVLRSRGGFKIVFCWKVWGELEIWGLKLCGLGIKVSRLEFTAKAN